MGAVAWSNSGRTGEQWCGLAQRTGETDVIPQSNAAIWLERAGQEVGGVPGQGVIERSDFAVMGILGLSSCSAPIPRDKLSMELLASSTDLIHPCRSFADSLQYLRA